MKRTPYAVPGQNHDDGTPVTFEADDRWAEKITFERLLELGHGNANGRREWYRERHPEEFYGARDDIRDDDSFVPEDEMLHRWAWNYARHSLTNYDRLVEGLSHGGDQWELCEACRTLSKLDRETNETQDYGLEAECAYCEANMVKSRGDANECIYALRLAIAAWVKTRWPQLEINEDRSLNGGEGGFNEKDLQEAVKELAERIES